MKINAGVTALLFKIGSKLLSVIIKLAKVLKVGKAGLAIGSAVSYAYLFTWEFAIMIMTLLLVHEYGHIWAMKRCGLKTKGIYFIPFLGAAAVSEEMFKSRRDEAYVAIMGPIFGLALSGVAIIIYLITHNSLFAAAAGWMAMVNLFNLLPINPLDGGRIMKSITFSLSSRLGFYFLLVGILVSMALTLWAGIFLFLILLIVATLELVYEYRTRNEDEIIKRCNKELDEIVSGDVQDEVKDAANRVRDILNDKKEDVQSRIKTVIAVARRIHGDMSKDTEYNFVVLSNIMFPILTSFSPLTKMTTKGVAIAAVAYIGTSVILWLMMTYMNNIPEVEIARQFFMS